MVVSRYSAWLVSHPITTKTLTAIALNSVAGVVAQTVIEDVPFERIDVRHARERDPPHVLTTPYHGCRVLESRRRLACCVCRRGVS